jgi:hypothetical protein
MHGEVDFEASALQREKSKIDDEVPGEKYPIFDPNHRRLILPDA